MVNRLAQSGHARAARGCLPHGACFAIPSRQRGFAAPLCAIFVRRAGTQSIRRDRAVLGASAADVIGLAL